MMTVSDEGGKDRGTRQSEWLGGRPVIIAANRGPVVFGETADGTLEYQRAGGGLVTALSGLCRFTDVTWIACAQSETDAVWREGVVQPLDDESKIRVHFLSPTPSAYQGYYNVISNPLLWFLQHAMWDVTRAPIIDRETWQAWTDGYVAVNQMFAQAIVRQARSAHRRALVMLQDYHLYLAPHMVRQTMRRSERPTLLHFVHIPWPGPEYWRILPRPMRHAIFDGLCAADILGFQTRDDALNFLRTCESDLATADVNFRRGRIWYRNHTSHIRDFPISIDTGALRSLAASPEVAAYRAEMQALIRDRQMILRVDRSEPSKNFLRGFRAYEDLLESYPEHRGQVVFLTILVPSRLDVDEYRNYLDDLMAAAGRINARFGTSDWEPVRLLVGEDYPRAVAAMQLYDVLLVNVIADGMNLVAKEGPIVNEREGVLILSERAGAAQQLASAATVIPPCDVCATTEAIHQALVMPFAEREQRAVLLRWLIDREDLSEWLEQQLRVVADLNL